MGMGPMTGGGRGYCGSGMLRNSFGFGWCGRGRGMGRGLMGMGLGLGSYFLRPRAWRRGFFPFYNPTSEEEASQLKDEASSLRDILSSIEQRLGELEKQKTKE